jgi:hypothetical protein
MAAFTSTQPAPADTFKAAQSLLLQPSKLVVADSWRWPCRWRADEKGGSSMADTAPRVQQPGHSNELRKALKDRRESAQEHLGVRSRSLSVSRAVPISHTDTSLARVRKAQRKRMEERFDDLSRIDCSIETYD